MYRKLPQHIVDFCKVNNILITHIKYRFNGKVVGRGYNFAITYKGNNYTLLDIEPISYTYSKHKWLTHSIFSLFNLDFPTHVNSVNDYFNVLKTLPELTYNYLASNYSNYSK